MKKIITVSQAIFAMFLLGLVAYIAVPSHAATNTISQITTLLNAATVTGTGASYKWSPYISNRVIKNTLTGIGAISATVVVEVNNDDFVSTPVTVCTFTPAGSGVVSEACVIQAPWPYMRGRITAISGTNASVTLSVGE